MGVSVYEYNKRIGFSECDTNKRFTITALIDAFQDCSTFQSEDLGVGFDVLTSKNLVWVINYWELEINALPHLCDRVTVGTFPYSFKSCFGMRNFYLKDDAGEYLVKANSLWTLIDSVDFKPAKAPDFIQKAYIVGEKLDMSYNKRKVMIPEGDGVKVYEKDPITIQRHHLDSNGHMNNGQYVKLAMSELDDRDIVSLRIDYRRQAMLGDVINPVVYENQNERVVALYGSDDTLYSVSQFITADQ